MSRSVFKWLETSHYAHQSLSFLGSILWFCFLGKLYRMHLWMTINFANSSIVLGSRGGGIEGFERVLKNAFVAI